MEKQQEISKFEYKSDYILNRSGVRKMDIGEEQDIALFYLEDLGDDDCVVGYTKLKEYKEGSKTNAVLNVSYTTASDEVSCIDFVVKDKKNFAQKLTGYVPVGEHSFVGIIKTRIFLIILPLLILLLLLGIGIKQFLPAATPSVPSTSVTTTTEPWSPDIDDNLGKYDVEKAGVGNIEVKGFSKWHVPAGKKDNLSIILENPASNRCYFTFIMTLDDTDEVIYQSKMVPPGEGIYRISLNKPLEAGEYNATIRIKTNEVKTGAEMNSAEIKAVIVSD